MPYPSHQLVQNMIRAELDATFSKLDQWFDRPLELLHFQPDKGWTIAQVLEHVHLTNHFLLLTPVSYTHLRAHETLRYLVCRLLLEKKK